MKNKIKVFVSGNFNVMHPGHTRLLRFAKECGDYLIVGVENDKMAGKTTHVNQDTRLEVIAANSWVNKSFIIKESIEKAILEIRPDIIVKGKEHENQFNIEEEVIKKIGGKLIFGSGNTIFSSLDLIDGYISKDNQLIKSKPIDFMQRHNLSSKKIIDIVKKIKNIRTCVIGDLIIDEYITCEAIGVSQEEPALVVTPLDSKKFIGGAGIVSSHSSSLGSKTYFLSISGKDELSNFAQNKLNKNNIEYLLVEDQSRPTTLKKRYRSGGKSLLRVNYLHQDSISKKIEEKLISKFNEIANKLDLLIFSDFSYGCLTDNLINEVTKIAKRNNIIIAADSQSSSQFGDITKFINSDLICATEREARLAIKNHDDGLVILLDKLRKVAKPKNIILKLGEEGALIQSEDQINQNWIVDKINPHNTNPIDVAGAGDSFLICSALALALHANIWESGLLGSIAASIQISRIGNIPLNADEIIRELKYL